MRYVRGPRGYSLPLVITLSAILAAAFFVFLVRLQESSEVSGSMLKRRQAFYAADGVSRAGSEIAGEKLLQLPPPDAAVEADPAALSTFLSGQRAQIQAEFDAKKASLAPPGFTIRSLTINDLGDRSIGTLQNGPFKGMVAQLQPMVITDEVAHNAIDTGAVSSMSSSVVRATLSMFQFFAFIDGYAYLYTGTGAGFAGRIHANGNICMGSGDALLAEKVTSAQYFYVARSTGCRRESDYHESETSAYIATRPLTGIAQLTGTRCDNPGPGCLWVRAGGPAGNYTTEFDKDGGGNNTGTPIADSVWQATNMARWNGQLQDASNGVPHLGVPITGSPIVQQGRNASNAATANNANSRFLVDPVLATEPEDVREQKFAYKADIRILNGVWYLRNLADPTSIGTPIWSDHPGHYATRQAEDNWTDTGSRNVGQDDLFGLAARPQRYSYYAASPVNTSASPQTAFLASTPPLPTGTRPVVSYGSLFRDTSSGSPIWVPGYFDEKRCNESGGFTSSVCLGLSGSPVYIWGLRRASTTAQLLQGARSGFRNGWGEVSSEKNDRNQTSNMNAAPNSSLNMTTSNSPNHELWNVAPLNFDVAAFAAALGDTSAGELGSYFSSSRPFNGIVWIGASWPGELDGMGDSPATSGLPTLWPEQGRQKDCLSGGSNCQPFRSSAHLSQTTTEHGNTVSDGQDLDNEPFQQALPFPLCSDSAYNGSSYIPVEYENVDASGSYGGPTSRFLVPACRRYAVSSLGTREETVTSQQIQARINAVRIINGKDLLTSTLPDGLTIATNLPAYVVGDYNSTSVPSDAVGVVTPSTNWRPALVAADVVSILSNAWTDANEPWNVRAKMFMDSAAPDSSRRKRHATATTYNMEVLAGWQESDNGNRDEVAYFTRLLENWTGSSVKRTFRGSIVIGFASLFNGRFDWNGESNLDDNASGSKVYGYDYNLDVPENQPPGAPKFQVTALRTFRRN